MHTLSKIMLGLTLRLLVASVEMASAQQLQLLLASAGVLARRSCSNDSAHFGVLQLDFST